MPERPKSFVERKIRKLDYDTHDRPPEPVARGQEQESFRRNFSGSRRLLVCFVFSCFDGDASNGTSRPPKVAAEFFFRLRGPLARHTTRTTSVTDDRWPAASCPGIRDYLIMTEAVHAPRKPDKTDVPTA